MKKICALFALVFALLVQPAGAISIGLLNDFEDGTLMGWNGSFNPGQLVNVPTDGPAGAGDHFLQVTADGSGSGGRLTTYNTGDWLGNYIAAGVASIELDLRNQGTATLSIRLAFKVESGTNVPGYLSQAVILPPNSGWQHISISITEANLIPVGGPTPYNTFFTAGPGDVRIINEAGTSNLNGDPVVGQLGIDNILAVPEPTTAALALGGLGLLGLAWKRRGSRA